MSADTKKQSFWGRFTPKQFSFPFSLLNSSNSLTWFIVLILQMNQTNDSHFILHTLLIGLIRLLSLSDMYCTFV